MINIFAAVFAYDFFELSCAKANKTPVSLHILYSSFNGLNIGTKTVAKCKKINIQLNNNIYVKILLNIRGIWCIINNVNYEKNKIRSKCYNVAFTYIK